MSLAIQIPSTLLEEIDLLTDSNWHTFSNQLLTVLASNDSDDIITGTVAAPSDPTELALYNRKNKLAKTYIWSRMSKEWRYLIDDKRTGSEAYSALKAKFQTSTFSRRVALRKAFSGCIHNPDEHIDIFLNAVTNAKAQLEAIGITIDDTAVKDVILGNLDDSFKDIRTSLLTQPTEPSLDTVRSVLSTSNPLVNVKSESIETALSAKYAKGRGGQRSGGSWRGNSGGGDRGKFEGDCEDSGGGGKKDSKGYTWCDPSNEDHCFRCGRMGHFATRCTMDMPPEIKEWIKEESQNERSMWVRPHSSSPSSRSCSPPFRHSPTRHVAFATHSRSPSSGCDSS